MVPRKRERRSGGDGGARQGELGVGAAAEVVGGGHEPDEVAHGDGGPGVVAGVLDPLGVALDDGVAEQAADALGRVRGPCGVLQAVLLEGGLRGLDLGVERAAGVVQERPVNVAFGCLVPEGGKRDVALTVPVARVIDR